jgi:hypothetical protein
MTRYQGRTNLDCCVDETSLIAARVDSDTWGVHRIWDSFSVTILGEELYANMYCQVAICAESHLGC